MMDEEVQQPEEGAPEEGAPEEVPATTDAPAEDKEEEAA
jgi:hypothetical protein